ncbi:oligosaccharide flippase family protein [Akkermansiaceae bacterium]|nr:oligosaccharide flippase family protein [Akkermansiaceae bacterium]
MWSPKKWLSPLLSRFKHRLNKFTSNDFGATLRDGWVYLSGSLLLKSLGFLSIPIMTRLLAPEDYGILSIFAAYSAIAACLFTLNTHVGISRYYHEKNDDFAEYFGTTLLVCSLFLLISFLGILLYQQSLAKLLNIPSFVIPFLIPSSLVIIFSSIHLQYFRSRKLPKKVRSFNVIVGFSSFILTIPFVYLHPETHRYMGSLWAGVVILFLVFAFVSTRVYRGIKVRIKKTHFSFMFSYGVPLLPAVISSSVLAQSDRVMIAKYQNYEEAGLYSFAFNIGIIMVTLSTPLANSFSPRYFELMREKRYHDHDEAVTKIVGFMSLIACGVILFAGFLGYILGAKEFHKSLYLIPVIVLSQYIVVLIPVYKRHISFAKKTIFITAITISTGLINVWLNYLFIPIYGSIAAAFTTLFSYLFVLFLTFIAAKYLIRIHVTDPRILLSKASVVGFSCVYYYIDYFSFNFHLFIEILMKLAVFIFCAKIVIAGFQKNDLIEIK